MSGGVEDARDGVMDLSEGVEDEWVAAWIAADPDPATRAELSALDGPDLAERFAAPLRFGTAG